MVRAVETINRLRRTGSDQQGRVPVLCKRVKNGLHQKDFKEGTKNLSEIGIWKKNIPGQGDSNRKDHQLGISRSMLRELKGKPSVCCDCSV